MQPEMNSTLHEDYLVEVLLGQTGALALSDELDVVEPVGELLVLLHELREGDLRVAQHIVRLPRQVALRRLQNIKFKPCKFIEGQKLK